MESSPALDTSQWVDSPDVDSGIALAAALIELVVLFQFVLYGLGMGFVLSALTLVAALVGHGAIRGLRRVGVSLQPLGAVVLLLAGGYVVYYWLTIGGILLGIG